MNERDRADQFSTEVDALLRSAGRAQDDVGPDVDANLDVARRLVDQDFSVHSQVRHTLRAQLLDRLDRDATPRERWTATLAWRLRAPRPALMAVTGAIAAVLLVGLLWPGALTAAAQGLERGIQRLFLGGAYQCRAGDARHHDSGGRRGAGGAAAAARGPVWGGCER